MEVDEEVEEESVVEVDVMVSSGGKGFDVDIVDDVNVAEEVEEVVEEVKEVEDEEEEDVE